MNATWRSTTTPTVPVLLPASLAGLFTRWGLESTLSGEWVTGSSSAAVDLGRADVRGDRLARAFFDQLLVPRDGSSLPIVFQSTPHTFAMRAAAARRGFQTFLTGALTSDGAPAVERSLLAGARASLAAFARGAPDVVPTPADAPALLVVSDWPMATYKLRLPSVDELKLRKVTSVHIGLEREDFGVRSLFEYVEFAAPALRALALQARAWRSAGLQVLVVGLEAPRGVTASGARPWHTSLVKRLAWEHGFMGPVDRFEPSPQTLPSIIAWLDQLAERYEQLGPAFAGQLRRIEEAKDEARAASEFALGLEFVTGR